ncbi:MULTISPECIES: hypothetical protein [Ruminococcus]|uniref:Lipoprotein n=1 Tax=Ruminococcus albus (strain ATCC 27210 / DSM 20455 / JCM 14654 / NCDO 2250 / 7) TaxID=697329 RepID=E6UHW2_RUMA7|nr:MULTISPECIES: hypothetical protein [Ruminococcus]ADU23249.1 hypothetical protein Rumal_2780 [Ruminococcus albus 7 = DSM 20455]MCR5021038.1 hypothetical protein [Ruminococcus sp.]
MRNKILTTLILSALLTASLASCGDTKEKKDDSSKAAAVITDDETTSDEEVTADEDTTDVPTADEDSSAAPAETTDSKAETTSSAADTKSHEEWLSQIEAHTFDNGSSFLELNAMGLGNVYQEGKAFAVVPSDAAAGSRYYKVYNSTDGGKNWLDCEDYREVNGDNTHIALDDGGLLLFSNHSARSEAYPIVSYLCFDGIGIKAYELNEVLAQTVLDDERLLKDVENIDYTVSYTGGYSVQLTLTDPATGAVVCDREFDFAPSIESALSAQ